MNKRAMYARKCHSPCQHAYMLCGADYKKCFINMHTLQSSLSKRSTHNRPDGSGVWG